MKKKLAIITTHPIQYNAPLFKLLAERGNINIKVFYTWSQSADGVYDPGFGKKITWDIPLLEGYDFTFVNNKSKKPGSKSFFGIDNPNLNKEIEEWGANAILVYGWAFKSHLSAMRYFKGKIPVYFRGDSTLLNERKGLKTHLRTLFLTWIYTHVDLAFYVGTNNKNYYLKHGLKEHQLVFAPHAIDNNRFSAFDDWEKVRAKKNDLGIKEGELVFLYAGKFEEVKQPELLLNAFLNRSDKYAHLIMVGNGHLEDKLRILAANDKNIHFMPFQNQKDMPYIYRLGDVFVLPSKSETWGLGVNEAMVSGLAVIASNTVGCAVDLVKNGGNGFVYKNHTELIIIIDTISKKRIDLISYQKLSKTIINDFNFHSTVESIEDKLK
jgi:glycosyltransferase involved in cell wall biosynthesis